MREKHQCIVAFYISPTGDPTHNPGMCPDWESNQQPFDMQAGTQSTEPHQPGLITFIFKKTEDSKRNIDGTVVFLVCYMKTYLGVSRCMHLCSE